MGRRIDLVTEGGLSRHIREVLEETGWLIQGEQGAAALLGMAPSTLRSRMQKLGVRRGKNS